MATTGGDKDTLWVSPAVLTRLINLQVLTLSGKPPASPT
jgi:hypothetical protein